MRKIHRMKHLVQILNLSRASIYRLKKSGAFIPHIQLSPRCVGYEDGALIKWLEERANNGSSGKCVLGSQKSMLK